MGLFSWAEGVIKKLTLWDYSAVKLYCVLIGMVIGAYVSSFVQEYVWWFIGVIVVLLVYLLYVVFGRK